MGEFRCLNCHAHTPDPALFDAGCRYGKGCGFAVGRFVWDSEYDPNPPSPRPPPVFTPRPRDPIFKGNGDFWIPATFLAFAASVFCAIIAQVVFGRPYDTVVGWSVFAILMLLAAYIVFEGRRVP